MENKMYCIDYRNSAIIKCIKGVHKVVFESFGSRKKRPIKDGATLSRPLQMCIFQRITLFCQSFRLAQRALIALGLVRQ